MVFSATMAFGGRKDWNTDAHTGVGGDMSVIFHVKTEIHCLHQVIIKQTEAIICTV